MEQSSHLKFCCGILAIALSGTDGRAAGQSVAGDEAASNASALPAKSASRQPPAFGRSAGGIEFVVGNIEYLLVHEIAHLLISEKNIPIIGPEENAADYIATLALIREEPLDPAQHDRAKRSLLASANAFAAAWQMGRSLEAEVPYWGAHALSIQRYYQIICLLYGSDPEAFGEILQSADITEMKPERCIAEYARAERAVEWLLYTYGRRPGDAAAAATEIVYGRPPTEVSASVVRELKSSELLERVVGRLHERFSIEEPFKLTMQSCGHAEAAWMPERRELVICFELVNTLYLLGMRANASEAATSTPKVRRGQDRHWAHQESRPDTGRR